MYSIKKEVGVSHFPQETIHSHKTVLFANSISEPIVSEQITKKPYRQFLIRKSVNNLNGEKSITRYFAVLQISDWESLRKLPILRKFAIFSMFCCHFSDEKISRRLLIGCSWPVRSGTWSSFPAKFLLLIISYIFDFRLIDLERSRDI